MSAKRGGLGRNLSALLGGTGTHVIEPADKLKVAPITSSISQLSIQHLQPGQYQPRTEMSDHGLAELAESIKKQGLLQPLVVRAISPQQYEIIAGERRWRACQLAELTEVPVIIRQVDDETAMAMALVENLQREDLNVMDQARAMQRLVSEFDLTHQQVAELLSKSRTVVSNYLRLLSLHADVKRMLEHGDIDMGHARCLLILEENQQLQVAQLVSAKNLSVRETEQLVARIKADKAPPGKKIEEIPELFSERLKQLEMQLDTKVTLKPGNAGKGTLIIYYKDELNLHHVLEQFMGA